MLAIKKIKKRTRLVNPEKGAQKRRRAQVSSGQRAAKKKRNPKKNPAELITLGAIVNPQRNTVTKKRKNGTKKAARKPNPVIVIRDAKAKKNPSKKRHHRSHNPSILGTSKEMVESGAYALAGLVVARQLPQMLLKTNNTGWKGYLSNAAAALAAAYAAGKFAGPKAANDVLIGGGLYLVNRVLTEQFSPIGKALSLSGVGDAAASSSMGRVKPGYFPLPVQRDRDGKPIIPQAIVDAVKAQLPAPAAAAAASKVSGVSRRMAPKFAA
ncbi:MAG TPA: hypothetical protein VFA28_01895 [Bryobacteraceae bacterium]|jgi:hypothetical protein|nr:hypothetical protein [Bryobacteraceae bacterium]